MELTMFKEAFIFGMGMVVDLSGSSYLHSQTLSNAPIDGIHGDWKQVGSFLSQSIKRETPAIEAESAKQLQLKLG
jgi:hypothetical protein